MIASLSDRRGWSRPSLRRDRRHDYIPRAPRASCITSSVMRRYPRSAANCSMPRRTIGRMNSGMRSRRRSASGDQVQPEDTRQSGDPASRSPDFASPCPRIPVSPTASGLCVARFATAEKGHPDGAALGPTASGPASRPDASMLRTKSMGSTGEGRPPILTSKARTSWVSIGFVSMATRFPQAAQANTTLREPSSGLSTRSSFIASSHGTQRNFIRQSSLHRDAPRIPEPPEPEKGPTLPSPRRTAGPQPRSGGRWHRALRPPA